MLSNNIPATSPESGYYHVWILAADNLPFFINSKDKAFFISLFQDQLAHKSKVVDDLGITNYADVVDLLAYSLTPTGVHMVVYSQDEHSVGALGQTLLTEYIDHLTLQEQVDELPFDSTFTYKKLHDVNDAFEMSLDLHLMHGDWRNDRYSSIGFYLDDRRGEWMRPWRVTAVYGNDPAVYLESLEEELSLRFDALAPSFLET